MLEYVKYSMNMSKFSTFKLKHLNVDCCPKGKTYHYVYRITNIILNKHYYGSRCSNICPINDIGYKYFSSSTDKNFIAHQKSNPLDYRYKVIKIFDNPGENILFESFIHQKFNVSKRDMFYNKMIQLPNGYTNTGNKDIGHKISVAHNTIVPGTNKTLAEIKNNKSAKTRRKLAPGSNKTIQQICNDKISNRSLEIIPGTSISRAKRSAELMNITKNEIIMGLNMTIKERSNHILSNTLNTIVPGTNKTLAEIKNNKSAKTRRKLAPGSNKTIQQICNDKQSKDKTGKRIGKKSSNFKGWYITPIGKFESAGKAAESLNITTMTAYNYCINNDKVIKLSSINRSQCLKINDLGKTYRKIGFSFITKEEAIKNNKRN